MDDELNSLATDLFRIFARFEYALKASGFHMGDGDAKADWRKFAVSVSALFDDPQDEAFKEGIAYILEHPRTSRWSKTACSVGTRQYPKPIFSPTVS